MGRSNIYVFIYQSQHIIPRSRQYIYQPSKHISKEFVGRSFREFNNGMNLQQIVIRIGLLFHRFSSLNIEISSWVVATPNHTQKISKQISHMKPRLTQQILSIKTRLHIHHAYSSNIRAENTRILQ